MIEHKRDITNINVWCGVMHERTIGFFCVEANVNSVVYLYMLELYFVHQLQELQPMVVFQQAFWTTSLGFKSVRNLPTQAAGMVLMAQQNDHHVHPI